MRATCAKRRTFKSSLRAVPAVIRLPYFRVTEPMRLHFFGAALLAGTLALAVAPALAATPTPSGTAHPSPKATSVVVRLPNKPLHTEVVVEVNKYGQVVRVKSTKPSSVQSFNVQTFGNALQMWIRRPDGSAQVGLYRISYDYNPKTVKVARTVTLISAGGSWADAEGAANVMMDTAKKEALEAQQKQKEDSSKLPSLNQIRGATPSPTPRPTPTLPHA